MFNISSLFSVGIIISSTFHEFSSIKCFGFTIWSANLFPINSLVPSAVLSITFLEAVFKESSPISDNWFLYFLANDKNPNPATYFIVLGSIDIVSFLFINKQCKVNFILCL